MASIESKIRRMGCVATAAALVLCPENFTRRRKRNFVLASRTGRQPRGNSHDAGLVHSRDLLPHQRERDRGSRSGTRIPGRAILPDRQYQSKSGFERTRRSRSPRSNLHFRNAGVGRPGVDHFSRHLRQKLREHCRDADAACRTDRDHAHGIPGGCAHLLWRFVSDVQTEVEQRRQQFHGLCRRRHSGRRL